MLHVILREADKITDEVLKDFENSSPIKEFDLHDGVIIGLLEDMVAKITSLKVLLDAQCYDSIDLITRSVFESHIYLKYILKQNQEKRAKAYAYSAKIDDLRLFDRITEETKVGRELRGYLGQSVDKIKEANRDALSFEYRERITSHYLNLLNTESDKTVWYNDDGKSRNIEQLCIKLNMRKEYELIYRIFSKDVHSNKALSRLKLSKNEVQVGNFDIDPTLHTGMSSLFLMESSREVLSYYKLKKQLTTFNTLIKINYQFK